MCNAYIVYDPSRSYRVLDTAANTSVTGRGGVRRGKATIEEIESLAVASGIVFSWWCIW